MLASVGGVHAEGPLVLDLFDGVGVFLAVGVDDDDVGE